MVHSHSDEEEPARRQAVGALLPEEEDGIARLLLRESSTLGIRVSEVRRH
jgi:hypothetical protein